MPLKCYCALLRNPKYLTLGKVVPFLLLSRVRQLAVVLVGWVGTGMTSIAQVILSKLDPVAYSVLTISLSAQSVDSP